MRPQLWPNAGIENQALKDIVSLSTGTTELGTQSAMEAEKASHTQESPNSVSDYEEEFDSDEEETLRYEVAQWPRHIQLIELYNSAP